MVTATCAVYPYDSGITSTWYSTVKACVLQRVGAVKAETSLQETLPAHLLIQLKNLRPAGLQSLLQVLVLGSQAIHIAVLHSGGQIAVLRTWAHLFSKCCPVDELQTQMHGQ